jgi:hypothetical protein
LPRRMNALKSLMRSFMPRPPGPIFEDGAS